MSIRATKKINENKLIKILNLLDSPMEGEVLAAAKSAARYVRSHGASWNELIQEPSSPPALSKGLRASEFIGLRNPVIVKRTPQARLIAVKLTNGLTENLWFPCSTLREKAGKIYVARWIVQRKEKELSERGISLRLQVDVH
jgi:hypothetical protein